MPNVRKYKSDFDHERFCSWHKARSQARFRKEQWQLSVEDWFGFWTPALWKQRGRTSSSVCLTRIDNTQPWSTANCEIVSRKEQIRRNVLNRPPNSAWWIKQYEHYK